MNLDGFNRRVRNMCGDRDGVLLEPEITLDWANDGQDDIAKTIKCLIGTHPIDLTLGVAEYALPTNWVEPITAFETASKTKLTSVNYVDLERTIPDWRNSTGIPYMYFFRGASVGFYPVPNLTETGYISLEHYRLPVAVSDPGNIFEIPEYACKTLVEYGLWKAKEFLEDFDAANYYKDQYISRVLNNVDEAMNNSTYPVIQDTDADYAWSTDA